MTIKDGIKFGIGFVIGKALVGATAKVLSDCVEKQCEKLKACIVHTENEDVEVE